jgi:hypothetical protein
MRFSTSVLGAGISDIDLIVEVITLSIDGDVFVGTG